MARSCRLDVCDTRDGYYSTIDISMALKPNYPLRDHTPTYKGNAYILKRGEFGLKDIDINEIALGLSRIFRYNGQSSISVLRHSYALSTLYRYPSQSRLYALLHDAPEAYLMDVPVAMKRYMTSEWYEDCKWVSELILEKYNCRPSEREVAEVGKADKDLIPFEMGVVWGALHDVNNQSTGPCKMYNMGGGEVLSLPNYCINHPESAIIDMYTAEVTVMASIFRGEANAHK